MHSSEDPNQIIISLYKSGLSGREIAAKVQRSLKKIYQLLRISGIKTRSSAEQNALTFSKRPHTFSIKKPLSSKETALMNAALMLYLGEGAKTGNTVDFTNSHPDAAKLFVKFLREICRIDDSKLRVYLYCYSSQNSLKLIVFWSEYLDVPPSQFTKPYISLRRSTGRVLAHGVVHIRYNDKRLLETVLSLCKKLLHSLLLQS